MKDGTLIIFGGMLFGILFWWWFPKESSLIKAMSIGLVIMVVIVLLRRSIGTLTLPRLLLLAIGAGTTIGIGVWWLTGRLFPWYWYAVPCAVLGAGEALFEHLATRITKRSKRAEKNPPQGAIEP